MSEQIETVDEATQDASQDEPRILGRPGVKANFTMSQRDYAPTPYRDSQWEVVGERFDTVHFHPLELEVIDTGRRRFDPMFEDFGGTSPRGRDHLYHTQSGEAQEVKEGEEEPTFDPAIIEAELAQRFEEGREQGFAEGEEAAKSIIDANQKELNDRLTEISSSIQEQLRACIQQLEANAAALAINVSRKILETTAEAKPEYIFSVIRQGILSLGGASPVRVRLSNQDMEFVEVIGMPKDVSAAELGVQYIADENIKSGCVIETSFGEVDLQLDHMWEQVRANLFGNEK